MNFSQKFRDFVAQPSHSRTMGILIMLVLVSAVSLTVIVAQQQQTLKQRASANCTVTDCNGNVCNAGQVCAPGISTSTDSYYSNCYCNAAIGPATANVNTVSYDDCVNKCTAKCPSSSDKVTDTCQSTCQANCSGTLIVPTTAQPPAAATSFNCGDKDCPDSQTCVGSSYSDSTYCLTKGVGREGSYCGTPNKAPNNDACTSGRCNSDLRCAASTNPTPTNPPPAADSTPTPPLTPISDLFSCQNQTGSYAGNYTCANIVNGTTQCPNGYSNFTDFSPYTGTSCGANQGCCKQNAVIPTSAPAPTVVPASTVTLGLTLNVQDMPATENNLSANLILYNLATNSKVAGAPAVQSFAKTPIPGKQYSANVPLTNLPQDKYFIIARKDNMIAKSVFTVSSATGNITVPTTILVFGDVDNNNDINILDYNILKDCWRKKTATGSCASSDFDKNGVIDQIDFNTLMRGWATWIKEGQNL